MAMGKILDWIYRTLRRSNEKWLAQFPEHEQDQINEASKSWRGTFHERRRLKRKGWL